MTPSSSVSSPALKTVLWGVFWASLSTSLGGMTVVFTRLIIEESDPLSLAFVRYGIAALIFLGVLLVQNRIPTFERRDMLFLTFIGTFMFAAFPFFMAKALEDTTAARGALIFSAMPLITICLASIARIEKLTAQKMLAVLVAIAGAAIALGENVDQIAPHALRGDVFMFLGMLSVSLFNVFSGKYLVRYGNLPVMTYSMFVGVLILLLLALIFGKPFSGSLTFDEWGWFIVFILAAPGGALMIFAWGQALRIITPTQATITIGFNPVTAILLAAWLLSEPITINVLLGFVLIFSAIVLASYRPRHSSSGNVAS